MDLLINGKALRGFKNIKILEFNIGDTVITKESFGNKNLLLPVILDEYYGYKELEIVFEYYHLTKKQRDDYEARLFISMFKNNFTGIVELDVFEDHSFTAVLTGSETKKIANGIYQITMKLNAYEHGKLVSSKLNETSNVIYCPSTMPKTPCIFTIKPSTDISVFTINNISMYNLNTGSIYIIDGIDKKVTKDGVNYFASTNLTEFPYLKPKGNIINISQKENVTISFYSLYL